MKASLTTLLFLLFAAQSFSQAYNTTLIGTWSDPTINPHSGVYYNDIWGYVHTNGDEYGIVGSPKKVHFIDLTNPSNPIEVASFFGGNTSAYNSIWRDFKTFGTYAYGVADQGSEGLCIFNLADIHNGNITQLANLDGHFLRAHNIYIDVPNARLYVAGSNTANGGLIIYDISTPSSPSLLAAPGLGGGYVHDLYVRNNIAYCSHGWNGLEAYDMTNATVPVNLGGFATSGYNHSSWTTADGTKLVYAEEVPQGMSLRLLDITDPSNMIQLSSFKFPNLAPAHTDNTPHNPFIIGNDKLIVSYYEDGTQFIDISDPANPVLDGYYDTYPGNSNYNGTEGNWGTYPFFPSGNIISSDVTNGFFVLRENSPGLPVELVDFSLRKLDNRTVELNWFTQSEFNNDYFEVERSADGAVYNALRKVNAAGTTDRGNLYTIKDNAPLGGKSYYRLKQMDKDGTFTYSNVRVVNFDEKILVKILAKNVVSDEFQMRLIDVDARQPVTVSLIGMNGVTAQTASYHSRSEDILNISVAALVPGLYHLVVENGMERFTKKIIVQ